MSNIALVLTIRNIAHTNKVHLRNNAVKVELKVGLEPVKFLYC
jgi:hypothetical protein